MSTRLDIHAMSINGEPVGCPACGTTRFTLAASGPVLAGPALANCETCSHFWEDAFLSAEVMRMIQQARTGRKKASDQDTFAFEYYGATVEGVLQPELCLDDVRAVMGLSWRYHAQPRLRKPKQVVKRALRKQTRKAGRAITGAARGAAGAATAAALHADWQTRTGGYEKRPIDNPCGACQGDGHFDIDTRLHGKTHVPCSVCNGTGETP